MTPFVVLIARIPLLPPVHGDPSLLRGPLWTTWQISPSVLIGVVALAAAYILAVGPLHERRAKVGEHPVRRAQRIAFLAGCVALLLALGPPLEDWAALLVSAHMAQHVMLFFVVPPLLLYGTPPWLLEPILRWPRLARGGYWLTRPVSAFVLSSIVIILWHVPVLYDASLRSEPIHVVQHLLFIGAGLLMWWPILGPLPAWPRPSPFVQILYLVALTLPGGFVGSFLTLGTPGLYAPYRAVPRMWGIDLATDQQIAGLTMWVGGGVVYLLVMTLVFFLRIAPEEAGQ